MKKILILFIITAFISCDTKTVEVEKSAGMTYNGTNEVVKKFHAWNNMDPMNLLN